LNRFFMARIGMRFICEQFLHSDQEEEEWSGVLHSKCSPVEVAAWAAEDAQRLAMFHLGEAPEIRVWEEGAAERRGTTFTYIPKHMHYILLELLKNASRATVHHHSGRQGEAGQGLPPIEVVVVHGREDVTLKITDRGGGIPRSEIDSIWTFMYSTAPTPASAGGETSLAPFLEKAQLRRDGAIAGYGVGLPMSRLYARYFGGDLDIKSVEGLGTDCYLHLPKLGENCENLPQMVRCSPGELDSVDRREAQYQAYR
jgi:pyruvate dehydrogenase kinase 2/3/4